MLIGAPIGFSSHFSIHSSIHLSEPYVDSHMNEMYFCFTASPKAANRTDPGPATLQENEKGRNGATMEVPPIDSPPRARGLRRRRPSERWMDPDLGQREEGRVLLRSSARMGTGRSHHRPPPPPPIPPDTIDYPGNTNQTQSSDNSQYDVTGSVQGHTFSWFRHLANDDGSYYRRRTTYASSAAASSSFPLTSYVQLLGWGLVAWVLYLLLPRGLRKTYCHTDRRRHRRHRQVAILPNQQVPMKPPIPTSAMKRPVSPPLNISVPRIRAREIDRPSPQLKPSQNAPPRKVAPEAPKPSAAASGRAADSGPSFGRAEYHHQHHDPEPLLEPDDYSRDESLVSLLEDSQFSSNNTSTTEPSSAQLGHEPRYHPAIPTPPNVQILRDTFSRLERGGIRLVAHGIHCESKRVWIQVTYDRLNLPESFAIKWQTEVCRTIQSADGRVSKVWIKRGGPGHTLPLAKVLCVDVGKNTSALASKPSLDPSTCFSLLTSTGSLDLEARSRLERDAIVCCLSRLLDQVHDVDWRQLYRESPEPSTVTSAMVSAASSAFPFTSIADTSAAVADADASMDDLSLI